MTDSLVHVRFTKWDGSLHWHFNLERLGEDEHGVWLFGPAGTLVQRGDEPQKPWPGDFVKLITPDRWWTAVWNRSGRHEIYVDTITPASWSGDTVTMVDLDLDVLRSHDGAVTIEDEDEFDEHRVAMKYPDHVVDKARAVTAQLAVDLAAHAEPFGDVGKSWLDRAG